MVYGVAGAEGEWYVGCWGAEGEWSVELQGAEGAALIFADTERLTKFFKLRKSL